MMQRRKEYEQKITVFKCIDLIFVFVNTIYSSKSETVEEKKISFFVCNSVATHFTMKDKYQNV